MLATRWQKYRSYMDDRFHRYLRYATGEILLVIAGILIALQIDAWYETRQVEKDLLTQLAAISESITRDRAAIARIKRYRSDALFSGRYVIMHANPHAPNDDWLTADFVAFADAEFSRRVSPPYFVPSLAAFKSLEGSGNTQYIKNDALARNLLDYYATVTRIEAMEAELKVVLRELLLKFKTETTRGFHRPLLEEPLLAWSADSEFAAEFRQRYKRLLLDPVTRAIFESGTNQPLMQEYQHLLTLGEVLIAQIDANNSGRDFAIANDAIYTPDSGLGSASVISEGVVEAHALTFAVAPTNTQFVNQSDAFVQLDDHLRVNYRGKDDWVFFYADVSPLEVTLERETLDYSRFDRLRLELKRHAGCENLRLIIKDDLDADDGSQANVKLELTEEWATYEYDLSLFSDADLTRLDVATGFIMSGTECSYSIRDVTFLKPDESAL